MGRDIEDKGDHGASSSRSAGEENTTAYRYMTAASTMTIFTLIYFHNPSDLVTMKGWPTKRISSRLCGQYVWRACI